MDDPLVAAEFIPDFLWIWYWLPAVLSHQVVKQKLRDSVCLLPLFKFHDMPTREMTNRFHTMGLPCKRWSIFSEVIQLYS